ncbi:MAG: hypothetical protein LBB56_08650 [Chitinispirillales bacterium]|jgi:hypothetical protein|nr:hypothetical protein [Chitinispirillales bacterium]
MSDKKIMGVFDAQEQAAVSGEEATRDIPKFDNSDILLKDAIEANGGKLEWADTGILSDTSW